LCINGNEYAKCQLRKRRIAFEALDNGILSCEDPKALQRICDGLDEPQIDRLLRKWLARLPHPSDRHDRAAGYRYAQEQVQIESWLGLIAQAARLSAELGLEVAECARLIKGYGDTYARGLSNYRSIEARLIQPTLAGQIPLPRAADAVASARTAALVDPEGESLAKCLAEIDGQASFAIAAE